MDRQARREISRIAKSTRQALFGVSGVWDDLRQQWDDSIADFQSKRAQLDQAESDLYNVQPIAAQDAADSAEWDRAFSKVNAAKSSMDAAAGAVSTVAGWWSSFTGAMGLSGTRGGLAGALGFALPAFPITLAGLAGLTIAAAAALTLAYGFIAYINEKTGRVQQLINAGVSPAEAVAIATKEAKEAAGYSMGANIEKTVMWAAFGLAAIFVLPELFRDRRR